jgi:hypothetical protein
MPDEAGTPLSTPSGASAGGAGSPGVGGAAPSSSSPKLSSASSRRAASAASACGPAAWTTIASPWRTPSVISADRLRASAGPRPVVSSATVTAASKRAAVSTKRAAGRACRPSLFGTSRRSSEPPEASTVAAVGAATSTPSWDAFIPSAARASVATSSSDAPVRARAAAATAPSTSGASHSSTSVSVTISAAISALITALPRSMSTITPSGDFARSIASITTTMSVPISPGGSAIPPAASIATSCPPICRASSTTPSARRALWETMTRPTTTGRPRGAGSRSGAPT